MARVTVEDCLAQIPNRFELVRVAAERTRQMEMGGEKPFIPAGDHKFTVIALQEIAAGYVTADSMRDTEE